MKQFNLVKKLSMFWLSSCIVMHASLAQAARDFGEIGNSVADQSDGLSAGVYKVGLFVGITFIVGGAIGVATHKKTNTPISYSLLAMLGGFILTSITAFIGSGSQSIFGTDANELNEVGL